MAFFAPFSVEFELNTVVLVYMNDNDLRDSQNDIEYKNLLAQAYPSPKSDIHAAVMERINAEVSHSPKKSKILWGTTRSRLVKLGSMAACLVILVTLGFRVSPMLNAKTASNEAMSADTAKVESVEMFDTAAVSRESAVTDESYYDDGYYEDVTVEESADVYPDEDENGTDMTMTYSATAGTSGFRSVPMPVEMPAEEAVVAEEESAEEFEDNEIADFAIMAIAEFAVAEEVEEFEEVDEIGETEEIENTVKPKNPLPCPNNDERRENPTDPQRTLLP